MCNIVYVPFKAKSCFRLLFYAQAITHHHHHRDRHRHRHRHHHRCRHCLHWEKDFHYWICFWLGFFQRNIHHDKAWFQHLVSQSTNHTADTHLQTLEVCWHTHSIHFTTSMLNGKRKYLPSFSYIFTFFSIQPSKGATASIPFENCPLDNYAMLYVNIGLICLLL